tara:strand:- start:9156 stop:10535 length:1380 start_codon:yes stop_codon:yes gene_type:complete
MIKDYDFRDFAGAAARAFNTLRFEPDKGLNEALQTIRQQRTANRAKNKTVEYLKGLGTPMGDRLAAMVGTGQLKGADAYKLMFDIESEQRAAARATAAADLAFERQRILAGDRRDFTASQNQIGRDFTASQNQIGRDFQADQNQIGRNFQADQNELNREARLQESKDNRIFQNNQRIEKLNDQVELAKVKAAMDKSEREKEIDRIQGAYGLSRKDAVGLVDGVLKVIPDPVNGSAFLYNLADMSVKSFTPVGADGQTEKTDSDTDKSEPTGAFTGKDATEALGLSGFGKNIANKISDAIVGQFLFDEAGEANAALRKLQADTVLAATVEVEGRPSNFTREMVLANYTIDPSSTRTGVADAIEKSKLMVKALEDTVNHYQNIVSGNTRVKPESISLATEELPKVKRYLADYKSLLESLEGRATIQSAPNLSSDEIDLINRNLPNEQKLNVTTPQFVPTAD